MGYWSVVLVIILAPFGGLSLWFWMIIMSWLRLPIALSMLFLLGEGYLAYRFNKTRNHGRADQYDDRLTTQRMDEARDELWPEKKE